MELLLHRAGIKMTNVPYKGQPVLLTDVMGERLPVGVTGIPGVFAHYKSGKAHFEKMKSVFEGSLAHVRKEPMFWQVYAYILHKEGDADGAIGVLARAHEALPDDAAVTENLTALQNGKKMSMRAYGDLWYQFGLETPKMPLAPRMPHPRTRTTSKRR
jgi:hypothetical protein